MTTVVQCDDGSYLNAELVYRWSITEDVTMNGHIIQAHVAGPQRPFLVATRETEESAKDALKGILKASYAYTVVFDGAREYAPVNLNDADGD